jgi:hypothetical protein
MNNTLKKQRVANLCTIFVKTRFEVLSPRCSHHKTGIDTHYGAFDEGKQAAVAAKWGPIAGAVMWVQR